MAGELGALEGRVREGLTISGRETSWSNLFIRRSGRRAMRSAAILRRLP